MNAVTDAVLPLFALIGVGYLASARRLFGPPVTDALNLFVVWMAFPALLFAATARMRWADVDHPGYAVASGGGVALTFALSMLLGRRGKRLADRAIEGLDAAFANTAFLGIPLGLGLFGNDVLPALVITTLLIACPLFGSAIVLIEIDLAASPDLRRTLRKVARSLCRNPLVVSPVAGGLWAATGLPLLPPVDRFLTLLGAAASPCALVTIGLFLQQQRELADLREVGRLVILKLFAMPLLTLALAWFLPMPRTWFKAALLLAALPTGTGPFVLAKLYERRPAVTSRVILLSTMLSVVTVSALVAMISP